ncbi:hypothetical protein PPSIR1_27958 [Plesiocystis pacifica SIR-1]|uniref:BioF2-like acetyltransferase domain-containing protein n=1 Tax=Plesiocystis pacifica SIR-1 TaxID=391625 RepID=A6FZL4_9BACT|nr:GNAT family N-acetyltransferase [Plesiocystis pacifica]EDM80820.1 hypothetical protein PPSIR1_27958 [Plesiocystis pacifica SIR-1]
MSAPASQLDQLAWLDASAADDRGRWDEVLARCVHDFHQLPDYVALEAARLGGEGGALRVEVDGEVGLLPLIRRPLPEPLRAVSSASHDALSPYGYPGPLMSSDAPAVVAKLLAAWRRGMAQLGLASAFVRLHPFLNEALAPALGEELRERGPLVWIDLEGSEEAQWGEYRSMDRRKIRRSVEAGYVAVVEDDCARFDDFYAVYAETMARLDASWSGFARPYLEGLLAALGSRAFLAFVEHEGQVAAGALFTRSCGMVQYHFSGTASAHRRAAPTRPLIHAVRQRCAAAGLSKLNLGGGLGSAEDELLRFKRGFSKRRGVFQTWEWIADPSAYAALCRAQGVDATSGFFPAYRQVPVVPSEKEVEDEA